MHEHHGQETKDKAAACGCCHDKRNRFFRGKSMNADAFALEQDYHIGRRRLVNRSVLGWGAVRGFALEGPRGKGDAPGPAEVGAGVGLDPDGREVVLAAAARLTSRNTFLLDGCRPRSAEALAHGDYLLSVHYAERRVEDALPTECGCGDPEKQFVCESAVFSLTPLRDGCPCSEKDCPPCGCAAADSCGDGRRTCLCQWTADEGEICGRPELCEWNGWWISPCDGIPLACLHAAASEPAAGDCPPRACEPLHFRIGDDCGPRRILKSNDLLYDLLRGCGLTRIAWTSWDEWHRSPRTMPWRTFAAMFHPEGAGKGGSTVRTDFMVRFSGPVLIETLRPDAMVMTAVTTDKDSGWLTSQRIPIEELRPEPQATPGARPLPPGTTDQFRVYVRSDWHTDEVTSRRSILTREAFALEIEVRGDYILDCRRMRIDGNARAEAGHGAPSGVGWAGKPFLSTFNVEPREEGAA